MDEYIKKEDALACFHNWVDSYGEINDPQCMPEYRAIEDLEGIDIEVNCSENPNGSFVTINDSAEENKVTNCNHNADVGKIDLIDRAEAQTALQFATRRYTVSHEAHGEGRVVWSDNLISVADAMNAMREVPSAQPEHSFSAVEAELEQVIKELEENGKHHADFVYKNGELVAEGIRLALIALEEAQLDERKIGKWIEHHRPYTWMGYTYLTCSECGYGEDNHNWIRSNFCPNCGAAMLEKKGKNDETD